MLCLHQCPQSQAMTSPCPLPLMPTTDWQAATARCQNPANQSGFMMCPQPQRNLAASKVKGTAMAPCQANRDALGNRLSVYLLAFGLLKAQALAQTCPSMTSRNPAQMCCRESEDSAPLAFMTSPQDRSYQRCLRIPLYPGEILYFPEVPQLPRSLCSLEQSRSHLEAMCRWSAGQTVVQRMTTHAAGSPVGAWALCPCWRRAVAEGSQEPVTALPARQSLTASGSARPPPPLRCPAPPLARAIRWPSAPRQSSCARCRCHKTRCAGI